MAAGSRRKIRRRIRDEEEDVRNTIHAPRRQRVEVAGTVEEG